MRRTKATAACATMTTYGLQNLLMTAALGHAALNASHWSASVRRQQAFRLPSLPRRQRVFAILCPTSASALAPPVGTSPRLGGRDLPAPRATQTFGGSFPGFEFRHWGTKRTRRLGRRRARVSLPQLLRDPSLSYGMDIFVRFRLMQARVLRLQAPRSGRPSRSISCQRRSKRRSSRPLTQFNPAPTNLLPATPRAA